VYVSHFGISLTRLSMVIHKITNVLNSNTLKVLFIKKLCCALLCLIFVFSSSGVAFTLEAHADDEGYIFDRVITWADGTAEHVQIGQDGFFRLNEGKKRLVGMDFNMITEWTSEGMEFWNKMALWEKELVYLESIGVRFINLRHVYLGPWGQEAERYGPVYDLLYEHKMLVVPHIWAFDHPEFGDLANPDFALKAPPDTMGTWAQRFADIIRPYNNVISVCIENEVNHREEPTPENVQNYINFVAEIINLDVPVIHNLAGYPDIRPEIMKAVLDVTDIPSFTLYSGNLMEYTSRLGNLTAWLNDENYPTSGFWLHETAKLGGGFTIEYIESAIASGVSVVNLHVNHSSSDSSLNFFDAEGNPVQSLVAIAPELERLQAQITATPAAPSDLIATPISSTQIDLKWTDNSDNETGYRIERKSGEADNFMVISQVSNDITSFSDLDLFPGTTYVYRVSTLSSTGSSTPSNEATATTLSSTLVLNPVGDKSVNEGQLLEFTVSVTASDGDSLTYSALNLPQGAAFDLDTQIFSWTPAFDQAGLYHSIHFEVSDGVLTAAEDITITVNNIYQPDVSNDGVVNVLDMIRIAQYLGTVSTNSWIPEDVNEDGKVDVLDAIMVGQYWTTASGS